jgi:hypothetical protein
MGAPIRVNGDKLAKVGENLCETLNNALFVVLCDRPGMRKAGEVIDDMENIFVVSRSNRKRAQNLSLANQRAKMSKSDEGARISELGVLETGSDILKHRNFLPGKTKNGAVTRFRFVI